MKKSLLACAFLSTIAVASLVLAQAPAPAAARAALGDITDTRTTGQFFSGMKVEIKLSGDEVFDAYGIGKPVFTVAKDDTGRSLVKDDKDSSLIWDLKKRQQKSANENVTGELLNPARKATTITLQGNLPVYAPSLDPSAIVTLPDITAIYGKTMESKETEISLTVLDKASAETFKAANKPAPSANPLAAMFVSGGLRDGDIEFRIKDPHTHLVRLEVIDADGKPIEERGRSKTTNDGVDIYTYSYNQTLPKGAGLKVYYATPKSMLNVTFSFENVPLP